MARMTTGSYSQEVAPGLRKVFFSSLQGIAREFKQIFNLIPEDPGHGAGRNYFEDLRVASIGTIGVKGQGVPITYDVPIEETKVRYTPSSFGGGFRVTKEMQEDDLYGMVEKLTGDLTWAAYHQIEVQAHRTLNRAFGTTGSGTGFGATGFNSEALIATNHALVRGGTQANRAATDLDLGVTAIEQLRDLFEGNVNESGMPMPLEASVLLIPYQLKWIAREITETELKPFSGNNEVNPLGGEGLRFMISHYLSSPSMWFLISPKQQHDMNVWMRSQPSFQMGDDFDTGDSKAKIEFRMASGHGDYRGIAGSLGQ